MAERLSILLTRDIDLARQNQTPLLGLETLLQTTHLDTSESDSKTLAERFLGDDSNFGVVTDSVRIIRAMYSIKGLNSRILKNRANPNEYLLAQKLVGLACAQIIREGEICGFAGGLVTDMVLPRPDIVAGAYEELLCLSTVSYLTEPSIRKLAQDQYSQALVSKYFAR